ncbi:hypothetical protein [Arthrobacter sp. zg-Y877]|uniref:hypothetical protein n=1 Tax=Arthrobacter sp. zg-Y877 TaxID=3049074 RepID=UPI0025A47E4E|nr:hypothetical protein [Arthrobacter sp. zg-Y877]
MRSIRRAAAEERSARTAGEPSGAGPAGAVLRGRGGRFSPGSAVVRMRLVWGRGILDPAGRTTDVVGGGGLGRVLRRAVVGMSVVAGG